MNKLYLNRIQLSNPICFCKIFFQSYIVFITLTNFHGLIKAFYHFIRMEMYEFSVPCVCYGTLRIFINKSVPFSYV